MCCRHKQTPRSKGFCSQRSSEMAEHHGSKGEGARAGRDGKGAGFQRRREKAGVGQRWVSWSYLASIQRMRFSR